MNKAVRENKKLFTQRELEKHINARLMRERKKNTELEALKKMLDDLMDSGAIDAGSYAEAGEKFMSLIAGNDEHGTSEENAVEGENAVEVPNSECTQGTEIFAQGAEAPENAEDFFGDDGVSPRERESEPADDAGHSEALPKDELRGRISALCSELARLLSGEGEAKSDGCFDSCGEFFARRSASSTGFSRGSAGKDAGGADGLTPTQREIARRAGISYREYAGLLREIPENIKKRRSF